MAREKPNVYVGRERTGKILIVAQAYLTHYGIALLDKIADSHGITITEIEQHKRSKP